MRPACSGEPCFRRLQIALLVRDHSFLQRRGRVRVRMSDVWRHEEMPRQSDGLACMTLSIRMHERGPLHSFAKAMTRPNKPVGRTPSLLPRRSDGGENTENRPGASIFRVLCEHQGIAALCLTDGPIRVIIVDSVIALFRVDFSGRGDLSVRQQKLGRHLSSLLQMASVRVLPCRRR